MGQLARVLDLDLSAEIAALPRMQGAQRQEARVRHEWITFHYSAVVYRDRTPAAERQRMLDEADYQLRKNWEKDKTKPPIYGDCFQYDFVVWSDGTIARTRDWRDPRQLWHCNNAIGNRSSIAVHVMLGGIQDLTQPQRIALFSLFDALRADWNIPRERVVSHCEWPRAARPAVVSPAYRRQVGQSACPGALLHRHIAAYRAAGR